MPVQLDGALELQLALREFTPNLAKEQSKELRKAAASVVTRARSLAPTNSSMLSGWTKKGSSEGIKYRAFPNYDQATVQRGIKFTDRPTKPNRSGYVYLARIVNSSAAGAIVETAGRKNPNGREQASRKTVSIPGMNSVYTTSTGKNYGKSLNPRAGSMFIQALDMEGKIVNGYERTPGMAGRASQKMRGRLIYRAWGEDKGKVNAAVIKAIQSAKAKFEATSEWRAR